MKRFLAAIIYICSLPLALVWNAKVSSAWNALMDRIYSCIVQKRLRVACHWSSGDDYRGKAY